ncbi:hypothetical protein HKD37_03G007326 [Glycine soja]
MLTTTVVEAATTANDFVSATIEQSGPLGPSRFFLQKVVASRGSNLARLGELGGKLLPYFAINRGRSEGRRGSAFLALLILSKLLRKIISVKKIQAEALPPMATPPDSAPPPPLPVVASQSQPPGAARPVVHVDPATGKVDGPHKKKLRTYLGIVARDKVDVTYKTWKQVPAAQEDIQVEFDILEASDGRTKKKILQTVDERHLQLTTTLWMTLFVKNTTLARRNGPIFVRPTETPRGRMCGKRHRPSISKTLPPTCCLVRKLMVEKTKKKMEEAAQSGSTEAVIDPPSPIRRHVKWKMARTKKTGQMTFETAKEITEKIDVLTAAIGRPEHPGRVRVVGVDVTIKRTRAVDLTNQGPTGGFDHRKSDSATDMQSQRLALPPEPEVGPSAACVNTKGSCVDPSAVDPDTGDSDKYGLYIKENPPHLVALGRVYEGSTIVQTIPLLHDQVKVGVEEVKDADALVPVPTDEAILVGQALNTFLAWPTHLIKRLSEHGVVSPAKPADRPDPEVDDPLYLMTLTIA